MQSRKIHYHIDPTVSSSTSIPLLQNAGGNAGAHCPNGPSPRSPQSGVKGMGASPDQTRRAECDDNGLLPEPERRSYERLIRWSRMRYRMTIIAITKRMNPPRETGIKTMNRSRERMNQSTTAVTKRNSSNERLSLILPRIDSFLV